MTLVADSNGLIEGKFTIPSNVPAGAKAVRVEGMGGTAGLATFTGRGEIVTEERRVVNTITAVLINVDPIAQTFTLDTPRHIAGLDVWFAVAGVDDVIVQIRDTLAGFPAQAVFAEQRLLASDIEPSGTATQVLFDNPVWLEANREYAIVLLTDGATAAVHVAQLGKFDANAQRWITSQPYQVGVLLSSSNASTWTAHQDKDMAFRLLGCKFSPLAKTIALDPVTVTNASDFIVDVNIDIPATGANAEIVATAPSGEVFRFAPAQPIQLPARITGEVGLSIQLTGTATASPVIYPGMQFIQGDLQETGTYVTRAFAAGTDARITVTFEALLTGDATVVVEVEDATGAWVDVPFDSGTPVGNGWIERTYLLPSITVAFTRVRLTLTGNPQHRPRVRQLRAVATD